MNLLKKQEQQTDLFLVPLYIMHIQVDVYCHFLTERFTVVPEHLSLSRVHLLLLQGVAEHQLHLM